MMPVRHVGGLGEADGGCAGGMGSELEISDDSDGSDWDAGAVDAGIRIRNRE